MSYKFVISSKHSSNMYHIEINDKDDVIDATQSLILLIDEKVYQESIEARAFEYFKGYTIKGLIDWLNIKLRYVQIDNVFIINKRLF